MKKTIGLLIGFTCCFFVAHAQQKPSQDKTKSMDAFITSLMSKMTLDEKIGQLNLVTPGGGILTGAVVSQGVEDNIVKGNVGGMFGIIGTEKIRKAQELAVNKSRLKIPMLFGSDVIHGYKTTFPIPLGLSASWNLDLIERSAQIAGREASADGLNWVFSPMVDIARDPRWGRIAESSGEDPYLGSLIAKAMVKGYQGDNTYAGNDKLMACVKHFALYGAAEAGRDYNAVDMSHQKMYEFYFPPYKAAVEAGVGSVMSSFNEVDGVPATGNKWLLTDVLRKQWGFKGMVTSDYTSVNEMIAHGMGNLQEVSALAVKAGMDMDMVGEGFLTTLKKSVNEGKVSVADINLSCRRILEAKYKLGLFTDPYKFIDEQRSVKEVLNPQLRNFACEAAIKSFVLLKNKNQVLPLKKTGTIALIGPLADSKRNMLGTWAVSGDWQTSVTVVEGLKNVVGDKAKVLYAKGANISNDTGFAHRVNTFGVEIEIDKRSPQQMLEEALSIAKQADVIVAAVGEAADMSGEAASRTSIDIPESQRELLAALVKTGKPVVLVLFNGRPLSLSWENENVDAILDVWFGGHEAGNAIADVLFGDYNPSGRLTATFPRNVGQVPIYYNHKITGRPYDVNNRFTSKYLDLSDNSPLYPFGYGLSYTTFSYGDLKIDKTSIRKGESIKVKVDVKNTGNYDGVETVQLYIQDLVASIAPVSKKLKGFQQISLKKGESKTVEFTITEQDLRFYNAALQYVSEPGEFKVFVGTHSRDVKEAGFSLK
ncbi:beta-glucosidase BglX [Solitalea longa]|uniref:Periplasmic beta-glucosidase n=1 Tax=Solitalea longa TaxID=2079460 RepID=A0A2S5A5W1_9SPHI|nr:beta-glucosidase BglX [Solitalea longa]POY37904.1 beta-glucosidase BglX [Solitalea longa]